jgi:DNA-binding transcriptional MerR regulator
VPTATVKYYLREGLLPPGRKVTARVAEYDERHVRRLRLIRVLREVGGLSVAALRDIVEAAQDEALEAQAMFSRTADAITATPAPPDTPRRDEAVDLAEGVIAHMGWTGIRDDAADRERLVAVVQALFGGPLEPFPEMLQWYAEHADRIATFEISALDAGLERDSLLEQMVVGTVVMGELLQVLRRLAQEHHSVERFGDQH